MNKKTILFAISMVFLAFNAFAKERLVQYPSGKVQSIHVESIDGFDIAEGDIIIADNSLPSAVIVKWSNRRWKNGVIPFSIDNNIDDENRENIYRALVEINYLTPVRFVERTDEEDFVLFTPSDKGICSSYVGRKGGKQEIILSPRCKKGSTMHEILHALGFWHEQSRGDRDNYIDIVWENILDEKKYNFSKHDDDGTDKGEYDYDSIMHYGPNAFTKNGEPTIVPLISGKTIGQREKLSDTDIETIKNLYG